MELNTSLRQLGRFSEPGLLILISLADGPKHGYAMLEDIEALAAVRLSSSASACSPSATHQAAC